MISAAFAWNRYIATPRSVPAGPRPISPIRAFIARIVSIVGLVFLFAFPIATLALLGAAGSLKWINNYGIQILIYGCSAGG